MEYVDVGCTCIGLMKNAGTYVCKWCTYKKTLDEDMNILEKEVQRLSSREEDIKAILRNEEYQIEKMPKNEVKNWLRSVQEKISETQQLRQKAGERRYFSRAQFLKLVENNIEAVKELVEHGNFPEGLFIHTNLCPALPTTPLVGGTTTRRNCERIWESLIKDDIARLGIYGMGGVGKTTVMTHIHNRLLQNASAHPVYWVTVSQESNIYNLQSKIAQKLKIDLLKEEEEMMRAAILLEALTARKKFVLILDDTWEHHPLEKVGIPVGIDGGKLVITTRSLDVCQKMECQQIIKMEPLSDEEAWDLFREKLGHDFAFPPGVGDIAKSVAKECAGLPLSIITTAASMRGVDDIYEWRNALTELRESIQGLTGIKDEVFKFLRFSYDHLSNANLQQCFLYCALYPEDHEIPRVELIRYWIAEGLIDEMNTMQQEFDRGHSILNKLINVCLLEPALEGCNRVKMHDVIRDMALDITRVKPAFIVKTGACMIELSNLMEWPESLERVSLMDCELEGQLNFISPRCPKLCTLLLRYSSPPMEYYLPHSLEIPHKILEIPHSFFMHVESLKVLDMSWTHIACLPDSISELVNLRALLLQGCGSFKYFPSLAKLIEMRELDLSRNDMEKLPAGIDSMVNLKCLNLHMTSMTEMIPSGVLSKLLRLQCLRFAVAGVGAEELISLRQLKTMEVVFSDPHEFQSYVKSKDWQRFENYYLQMGATVFSPSAKRFGKQVTLNYLHYFGGIGEDQLSLVLPTNIQELQIYQCLCATSLSNTLPSLKYATNLERLRMETCCCIEHLWSINMGAEISEHCASSFLWNLKTLMLIHLPDLRVLFKLGEQPPNNAGFSNLRQLSITACPNIKYLFTPWLVQHCLQNLEVLYVCGCEEMENIIIAEDKIEGAHENSSHSTFITFPKLKSLVLHELSKLQSICRGTMVCPSLQEIGLECPILKRLPIFMQVDSDDKLLSPPLKTIGVPQEWWDMLEWDDPRVKSLLQPLHSGGIFGDFLRETLIWDRDFQHYEEMC